MQNSQRPPKSAPPSSTSTRLSPQQQHKKARPLGWSQRVQRANSPAAHTEASRLGHCPSLRDLPGTRAGSLRQRRRRGSSRPPPIGSHQPSMAATLGRGREIHPARGQPDCGTSLSNPDRGHPDRGLSNPIPVTRKLQIQVIFAPVEMNITVNV